MVRHLSATSAIEWCQSRGVQLADGRPTSTFPDGFNTWHTPIPRHTHAVVAFVRGLLHEVGRQPSLLWITAAGIWSGAEVWPLVDTLFYRSAESRPMSDVPRSEE